MIAWILQVLGRGVEGQHLGPASGCLVEPIRATLDVFRRKNAAGYTHGGQFQCPH